MRRRLRFSNDAILARLEYWLLAVVAVLFHNSNSWVVAAVPEVPDVGHVSSTTTSSRTLGEAPMYPASTEAARGLSAAATTTHSTTPAVAYPCRPRPRLATSNSSLTNATKRKSPRQRRNEGGFHHSMPLSTHSPACHHRRRSHREGFTLHHVRGGGVDSDVSIAVKFPSATDSCWRAGSWLGVSPGGAASEESATTETTEASAMDSTDSVLGSNAPPPGRIRRTFPTFPWHKLPNWLTYMRCLAVPLLIMVFYWPTAAFTNRHWLLSILFATASMTDWLDGYLARRWDIVSTFGAFLDPVADKLMVSTALILLSGRHGSLVAIPCAIILGRELAVSALREWMAQRGKRDSVKVGWQGKVKTAATMVALTFLLLVPEGSTTSLQASSRLFQGSIALLYVSTFLTITSGSVYFRAAAPVLLSKEG